MAIDSILATSTLNSRGKKASNQADCSVWVQCEEDPTTVMEWFEVQGIPFHYRTTLRQATKPSFDFSNLFAFLYGFANDDQAVLFRLSLG